MESSDDKDETLKCYECTDETFMIYFSEKSVIKVYGIYNSKNMDIFVQSREM